MKKWRTKLWTWALVMAVGGPCLSAGNAPPPAEKAETKVFQAQPEARALYDQMIAAYRQPQTLSYKSEIRLGSQGRELVHCTYTVWLKKPNYFRVEVVGPDGVGRGTIVGDGETLWLFWPGDRPRGMNEDQETYAKTRSKMYMKHPAPLAQHSIGHEMAPFGCGMPTIDPSTFHGYTDSLQRYIDGVMGMGREKVGDQDCDVIEVSLMKHQRSRYFWLSRKDHLPRKLKETIRVSSEMILNETWSDLVINGNLPADKFVWTPPPGWQQWEPPSPQETLLKPGTPAPDFELTTLDGTKVKLSDFRDQVVWFYIWRAG
jgi:outer membrane lipoprotein-sorting protein